MGAPVRSTTRSGREAQDAKSVCGTRMEPLYQRRPKAMHGIYGLAGEKLGILQPDVRRQQIVQNSAATNAVHAKYVSMAGGPATHEATFQSRGRMAHNQRQHASILGRLLVCSNWLAHEGGMPGAQMCAIRYAGTTHKISVPPMGTKSTTATTWSTSIMASNQESTTGTGHHKETPRLPWPAKAYTTLVLI